MENPRNKNKMIKESSDITFRVLCVAPKSMPANGETAIYEIDIQSDFEFCNGSRKMRLRKSSGEIAAKSIATKDSSTETKKASKRQNCKNPIIQSYYPTLLDTCSEGSESQLDLQTSCKEVTFAVDSEKFYREEEEDDETQKSDDEPVLEITDLKKAAENTEIAEVDKPQVEIAEVQKSVVEITEMPKPEVQKPVVQTSKPVVQIAEVQKLILHIAELQKSQAEKSGLEELEVQTARLEKPIVEITELKPVLEKIGINVADLHRSDFAKTQTVLSENVPKVLIERAEVDKVGIEEVGMRKFGLENAISSAEPEKGEIRKVNVDKSGIDKPELDGTEKGIQSSVSDNKLEQNFKTFLIENFFKKNSDLKALFQSTEKKAEPNELHLHHHEHHHHYYFDGNSFMKEQDSPRGPPQGPPGPGPDLDPGPGSTFFYKCEAKSNSTFTRVTKSRMAAEFQEGRASAQCSVSDESVLDKKSEFIKSHTYSDSDFTKVHSGTEVVEEEQQPLKSSKEGLSLLAASLRSAAQYKAPLIITDQEKLPKISYITCECNSADNIPRTSTVSFSSDLNTEELDELEELSNSDKTSGDSEDKTSVPTDTERPGADLSIRKMYFEIWTAKLKTELRQIKEELKKFEKEHMRKKLRHGNADSTATKNVTVYSSKTFIIRPGNVYVVNNCEARELGDCGGFFYKKRKVSYGETILDRSTYPGEKKNPKKRQIFHALREIVLQRV